MDFRRLRSFPPVIPIGSGWQSQSVYGWAYWASQRSSFIGFPSDRDCRSQKSRQWLQTVLIPSKQDERSSRETEAQPSRLQCGVGSPFGLSASEDACAPVIRYDGNEG